MTAIAELKKIGPSLNGSKVLESEIDDLVTNLPQKLLPAWFVNAVQTYPLAGVCFSLNENDDESGLGVDLKWFTTDQIIDEALFVYPGEVVLSLGYLPVGACSGGSGDPYFFTIEGSGFR